MMPNMSFRPSEQVPVGDNDPTNPKAEREFEHIQENKKTREHAIEARLQGYETIDEEKYDSKEKLISAQENYMEGIYPLVLGFLGFVTTGLSIMNGYQQVPLFIGLVVLLIGAYWHIHVNLKKRLRAENKMHDVDELEGSSR
jgi:hypothetical protein